jgi:hypothetical protein
MSILLTPEVGRRRRLDFELGLVSVPSCTIPHVAGDPLNRISYEKVPCIYCSPLVLKRKGRSNLAARGPGDRILQQHGRRLISTTPHISSANAFSCIGQFVVDRGGWSSKIGSADVSGAGSMCSDLRVPSSWTNAERQSRPGQEGLGGRSCWRRRRVDLVATLMAEPRGGKKPTSVKNLGGAGGQIGWRRRIGGMLERFVVFCLHARCPSASPHWTSAADATTLPAVGSSRRARSVPEPRTMGADLFPCGEGESLRDGAVRRL